MSNDHVSSDPFSALQWTLPRAAVRRLPARPEDRVLAVTEGRVWLTRTRRSRPGEDIWLAAGDVQALPAGTDWVIEAWPQARVVVAESPARGLC